VVKIDYYKAGFVYVGVTIEGWIGAWYGCCLFCEGTEGGLILLKLEIVLNCKAAILIYFFAGGDPKPNISQSASLNTNYFLFSILGWTIC
jgi:hypothetical protein